MASSKGFYCTNSHSEYGGNPQTTKYLALLDFPRDTYTHVESSYLYIRHVPNSVKVFANWTIQSRLVRRLPILTDVHLRPVRVSPCNQTDYKSIKLKLLYFYITYNQFLNSKNNYYYPSYQDGPLTKNIYMTYTPQHRK